MTATGDRWLPQDTSQLDMGSIKIRMGGVAEISEMLGSPRSTISMWDSRRASTGFPEPILRLAAGPIYDLDAVQAWWNAREVKA